jgi:ATP-dependent Clp protease adaptor protein ClpS
MASTKTGRKTDDRRFSVRSGHRAGATDARSDHARVGSARSGGGRRWDGLDQPAGTALALPAVTGRDPPRCRPAHAALECVAMVPPARPATKETTKVRQKPETALAPPWNVIVHDDPVTLMTYVTRVFMQVFGYPQERARRLMLEVHHTGRSVVWTGAREQAEVYCQKLQSHHLLTTLEAVDR